MAVARLILVLLCGLLPLLKQGQAREEHVQEQELPAWTSAPAEANLFVVETEEFSNHLDVTNGLLPAVKKEVTKWAQRNFGPDAIEVLEPIPVEEFRELVHENQEIVHESKRYYDDETAKRLNAESDNYYRGFIRVNVNASFHDRVEQGLASLRLKNRLCFTFITALFVIGAAAICWSYLYANQISRGFYIGRLRWIAGGLFVSLILICYSALQMLF